MGRWSQSKLRGTSPPGGGAPLPVPFLEEVEGQLFWSVDLDPQPAYCRLDSSDDGVSGWAFADQVGWETSGSFVPASETFFRCIGLDVDNNPVTQTSNVIFAH